MAFRCPQCQTADGLEIIASIELPPDRYASECSLQVVSCQSCGFRALAVYEEPRQGETGREAWRHIGYWVSPDAVEAMLAEIRACPQPFNPHCSCPVHTSLTTLEAGSGRWRGLLEMKHGHTFWMRAAL